jgi:hypothetical protein
MAFTTLRWDVTYTLRDNNDNYSSVGCALPGALTLAQAETFAAGLAVELQTRSSAALVAYGLNRLYANDAPITPTAESEVERKLVLMWSSADGRDLAKMEIPSPVFTMEVDGTDIIPTSSAALAPLIAIMTNGGAGGGNGPITAARTDITKLKNAAISHRYRTPKK